MLEVRESQILRRYQIEDRENYTKLLSPQQVVYNVTYNSRLWYIYIYSHVQFGLYGMMTISLANLEETSSMQVLVFCETPHPSFLIVNCLRFPQHPKPDRFLRDVKVTFCYFMLLCHFDNLGLILADANDAKRYQKVAKLIMMLCARLRKLKAGPEDIRKKTLQAEYTG